MPADVEQAEQVDQLQLEFDLAPDPWDLCYDAAERWYIERYSRGKTPSQADVDSLRQLAELCLASGDFPDNWDDSKRSGFPIVLMHALGHPSALQDIEDGLSAYVR